MAARTDRGPVRPPVGDRTPARPVAASASRGGRINVNRSVPPPAVVPVLAYRDVRAAAAFLTAAFDFDLCRRASRSQMAVDADGAVVVADAGSDRPSERGGHRHLVRVRVEDVDAEFARARDQGALVIDDR